MPFGPAASQAPAARPVLQLAFTVPAATSASAPPPEIAAPVPISADAREDSSPAESNSVATAPLADHLPRPDTPPVMLQAPAIADEMLFGEAQGYVVLELDVDPAGRVIDSRVLDASLDAAQVDTLTELARRIEFAPAKRKGQAIAGRMIIRFEYRPAEPAALRYEWIPDYQPNAG